jgi:hypothetical protein
MNAIDAEHRREQERRRQQEELKSYNLESASPTGTLTKTGRARRHLGNKGKDAVTSSDSPISRYATAVVFNKLAERIGDAVRNILHLAHQRPDIKEHLKSATYIKVDNTMDAGLTVAFAPVSVSTATSDILKQQIGEVKAAQAIVHERHMQARFLGPFIEEKEVYRLKHAFHVRYDPDADCYGHCIRRVEQLEAELNVTNAPRTEMAYIFGVTAAPISSRGYDSKIAEVGAEISESNLANIEATLPARPIPPPQFNIV